MERQFEISFKNNAFIFHTIFSFIFFSKLLLHFNFIIFSDVFKLRDCFTAAYNQERSVVEEGHTYCFPGEVVAFHEIKIAAFYYESASLKSIFSVSEDVILTLNSFFERFGLCDVDDVLYDLPTQTFGMLAWYLVFVLTFSNFRK